MEQTNDTQTQDSKFDILKQESQEILTMVHSIMTQQKKADPKALNRLEQLAQSWDQISKTVQASTEKNSPKEKVTKAYQDKLRLYKKKYLRRKRKWVEREEELKWELIKFKQHLDEGKKVWEEQINMIKETMENQENMVHKVETKYQNRLYRIKRELDTIAKLQKIGGGKQSQVTLSSRESDDDSNISFLSSNQIAILSRINDLRIKVKDYQDMDISGSSEESEGSSFAPSAYSSRNFSDIEIDDLLEMSPTNDCEEVTLTEEISTMIQNNDIPVVEQSQAKHNIPRLNLQQLKKPPTENPSTDREQEKENQVEQDLEKFDLNEEVQELSKVEDSLDNQPMAQISETTPIAQKVQSSVITGPIEQSRLPSRKASPIPLHLKISDYRLPTPDLELERASLEKEPKPQRQSETTPNLAEKAREKPKNVQQKKQEPTPAFEQKMVQQVTEELDFDESVFQIKIETPLKRAKSSSRRASSRRRNQTPPQPIAREELLRRPKINQIAPVMNKEQLLPKLANSSESNMDKKTPGMAISMGKKVAPIVAKPPDYIPRRGGSRRIDINTSALEKPSSPKVEAEKCNTRSASPNIAQRFRLMRFRETRGPITRFGGGYAPPNKPVPRKRQ